MDSFDEELTFLFFKVLKRTPIQEEKTTYRAKFFDLQYTLPQIEELLYETAEYIQANTEYSTVNERATYNMNVFSFEVKNIDPLHYRGVQLTNGKTGIITSPYVNKVASSFITTNCNLDQIAKYNTNLVETFDYSGLNFFEISDHNVRIENHIQHLDAHRACFTNEYDLIYVTPEGLTCTLSVRHNMRSLRQYPYCFLNSYEIVNTSNDPEGIRVPLYHLVRKSDNLSEDVEHFNNNMDDVLLFSSSSHDRRKDLDIVTCSSYIYDNTKCTHIGHNLNNGQAYNLFHLDMDENQQFEFHIVTGTMTTHDFPDPKNELKRILTTIVRLNGVDKLISTHNALWTKIWTADIEFEGKLTNNIEKTGKLENLRKNVKYSLFNLFSSIRDDVSSDYNPLKIHAIDSNGDLFWNSDLFLIPVLIVLKSSYAKTLIDNRFHQLETAKALAASYGYKGAKFPHDKDVFGYNDIYWNTSASIYVFNTGLVVVNSWNYFRVSQDSDWLREKGIKIFTHSADFFTSILDSDGNIPNTFSLNNVEGTNNIMSLYYAALSIKIAIESYYEVNYKIKKEWKTAYQKIITVIESRIEGTNEDNKIFMDEEAFSSPTSGEISELLLLFTSYHSKLLFSLIPSIQVNDYVRSNINYYEIHMNDTLSINKVLFATMYAKLAQTYSGTQDNDLTEFDTRLKGLFNDMDAPWGGCASNEGLIFVLLFGLSEFIVTGSINFDRFYTERYGVKSKTGYVLPDYVHKMKVTINSTRVEQSTYNINNIK